MLVKLALTLRHWYVVCLRAEGVSPWTAQFNKEQFYEINTGYTRCWLYLWCFSWAGSSTRSTAISRVFLTANDFAATKTDDRTSRSQWSDKLNNKVRISSAGCLSLPDLQCLPNLQCACALYYGKSVWTKICGQFGLLLSDKHSSHIQETKKENFADVYCNFMIA